MVKRLTAVLVFASVLLAAASAHTLGIAEVKLELPTIHCLGVRCFVTGDTGKKEVIRLEYRKAGGGVWKRALDLFRTETKFLRGVRVPAGQQLYAGSVFDLEPDTRYDLRVSIPDGASRVLTTKTWKEPVAPKPLRTLYVVPGKGGGAGTRRDPFKGLEAADAAARPGDLILIGAGVYRGTIVLRKSGTAAAPIVFRGTPNGKSIIDGGGAARGVSNGGTRHVMFENLTIRNAEYGMVSHGSSNLTLRRCRFTKVYSGFTSTRAPCRRHVIVDCVFEGPSTWPRTKGIEGSEGVQVVGEGHIVAYNRLRGFADAISIHHAPGHAIDFYNNDISECTDDGIEMDAGGQNTRCFRNRLTNCFQGLSVQPLFGGPCYLFRNVQYNTVVEMLKMHNTPSGFLFFHNTVVKSRTPLLLLTTAPTRNSVFRNNLFIGTRGKYAFQSTSKMINCDWDYDGFGGGPWKPFAEWNNVKYRTFADLRAKGPVEKHAVLVDARTVFASGIRPPKNVKVQFRVGVNDLRLKAGTKAIDAGIVLPNINDGFKGKAPDLGAYEFGDPLPHYGPRPRKR